MLPKADLTATLLHGTRRRNGKERGEELRISKHFKEDSPMAWLFLLVAGLCEIAWAIGLKYTEGFSRLLPTIGTVAAMAASIGCLGLALKSLPVGTAYAVWTGIGTIGTAALGIYLFNEPATLLRLACIGLILSGIIGLKITG
jgi:quaternary ammonium compound-resistance protein SugE